MLSLSDCDDDCLQSTRSTSLSQSSQTSNSSSSSTTLTPTATFMHQSSSSSPTLSPSAISTASHTPDSSVHDGHTSSSDEEQDSEMNRHVTNTSTCVEHTELDDELLHTSALRHRLQAHSSPLPYPSFDGSVLLLPSDSCTHCHSPHSLTNSLDSICTCTHSMDYRTRDYPHINIQCEASEEEQLIQWRELRGKGG